MQPSIRHGEMLHNARQRAAGEIIRDPLFWVMLTLVAAVGVRALNSGVDIVFNAESATWEMASASMPLYPASCADAGFLPFSAAVACLVIVTACRHSLGRAARHAYLLVSSSLAGAAAAIALYQASIENPVAVEAFKCPMRDMSYVGCAFGLHLIAGISALAATVENRWNRALPLTLLSIGGTSAGVVVFSPTYDIAMFLSAALATFLYAFFYCMFSVKAAAEFKFIMFTAVCLALGLAFASATVSMGAVTARISDIIGAEFFREGYLAARKTLSAIAVKSWVSHPWAGTGIDSFVLDMRFNAAPGDWVSIPRGITAAPFGWLTLIAERGILGAAALALPVAFMAFTFIRRLVSWFFTYCMPPPACLAGLLALVAVAASAFFDCSFLRADVMLAVAGLFALSASSFPKTGREG